MSGSTTYNTNPTFVFDGGTVAGTSNTLGNQTIITTNYVTLNGQSLSGATAGAYGAIIANSLNTGSKEAKSLIATEYGSILDFGGHD